MKYIHFGQQSICHVFSAASLPAPIRPYDCQIKTKINSIANFKGVSANKIEFYAQSRRTTTTLFKQEKAIRLVTQRRMSDMRINNK